jgi:hypothetical protein
VFVVCRCEEELICVAYAVGGGHQASGSTERVEGPNREI